jgi:hypothetical protein
LETVGVEPVKVGEVCKMITPSQASVEILLKV